MALRPPRIKPSPGRGVVDAFVSFDARVQSADARVRRIPRSHAERVEIDGGEARDAPISRHTRVQFRKLDFSGVDPYAASVAGSAIMREAPLGNLHGPLPL